MRRALHVVVPGPLEQRTGGYLYDARMVEGLRAAGWQVVVHNLDGLFPSGDEVASRSAECVFTSILDGSVVLIDGLALVASAKAVERHAQRLMLLALVHHPLSDERGLTTDESSLFLTKETRVLRLMRGVIVTSQFTSRRLQRIGLERNRIRVVLPGTDPVVQRANQLSTELPRLLVVGSLIPRKGHDVLMRALGTLGMQSWHCVCAGSLDRDRRFAEEVMTQAGEAGIGERVEFVGECNRSTLEQLYAGASIFVLPSYYEGYGMVLAEALAYGLPIVSTTGGAIPETVPAGAGILVAPGDHLALANALGRLLDGETGSALRGRYARTAHEYGNKLPSWNVAVGNFEKSLFEFKSLNASMSGDDQ